MAFQETVERYDLYVSGAPFTSIYNTGVTFLVLCKEINHLRIQTAHTPTLDNSPSEHSGGPITVSSPLMPSVCSMLQWNVL